MDKPALRSGEATNGITLRILVVDDNPANQIFAVYVLEDQGYAVEIAESGPEALKMVLKNHYDAILMDVQMPDMNGIETTMAIRAEQAEARRVPIIALTASTMEDNRQRCLAAGMDAYLSKPLVAQELIVLLEELVNMQRESIRNDGYENT